MVECLTRDRGSVDRYSVVSLSKTHPGLVMVLPSKTRPYIIDRLLLLLITVITIEYRPSKMQS